MGSRGKGSTMSDELITTINTRYIKTRDKIRGCGVGDIKTGLKPYLMGQADAFAEAIAIVQDSQKN
jgi:hypothetical protein